MLKGRWLATSLIVAASLTLAGCGDGDTIKATRGGGELCSSDTHGIIAVEYGYMKIPGSDGAIRYDGWTSKTFNVELTDGATVSYGYVTLGSAAAGFDLGEEATGRFTVDISDAVPVDFDITKQPDQVVMCVK